MSALVAIVVAKLAESRSAGDRGARSDNRPAVAMESQCPELAGFRSVQAVRGIKAVTWQLFCNNIRLDRQNELEVFRVV